jgi:hypothetical protein
MMTRKAIRIQQPIPKQSARKSNKLPLLFGTKICRNSISNPVKIGNMAQYDIFFNFFDRFLLSKVKNQKQDKKKYSTKCSILSIPSIPATGLGCSIVGDRDIQNKNTL